MSNKNGDTGVWSIRGNGEIVSEFGGYEFLGRYNITDMVLHWRELGFEYAIVSKDLFDKFVKDSLRMFVSPRLYLRRGRIEYGDFIIFQEKTQSTKSMSEYKENTVGWWLSQLKEPLKSRALRVLVDNSKTCDSIECAIKSIWDYSCIGMRGSYSIEQYFWRGVFTWYFGGLFIGDTHFREGYRLAEECMPTREDKAIVDSPTPEVWGEKIPIGKIEIFTKGWDANTPIEPLPEGGYIDGKDFLPFRMKDKIPRAREIEAPERAVVGYEEPKPIDTIEKKHELRIKNLEAYNKYQAERNQQIMDLNPHVDFCDSEGNLIRPSRMTALEARVKQLEGTIERLEIDMYRLKGGSSETFGMCE